MIESKEETYITINPLSISDIILVIKGNYKLLSLSTLLICMISLPFIWFKKPLYESHLVMKPSVISAQETDIALEMVESVINEHLYGNQKSVLGLDSASLSMINSLTISTEFDKFVRVSCLAYSPEIIEPLLQNVTKYLETSNYYMEELRVQRKTLDSTLVATRNEIEGLNQIKEAIEANPKVLDSYSNYSSSFHYDLPVQLVRLKQIEYSTTQRLDVLNNPFPVVSSESDTTPTLTLFPKTQWSLLIVVAAFCVSFIGVVLFRKNYV